MIVDTHVHVVSPDRTTHPQQSDAPDWHSLSGEALLAEMDATGVDRAVLVQTYFTYGYDNAYMTEVALAHRDRFVSVCVLDPLDPASPDTLSRLVAERGVRGIRLMNDRGRMAVTTDDPRTFPLWQRVAELGIVVCIASLIEDVFRVRVPLELFPKVPVAIDHIWGLKVGDGPDFPMLAPVLDLASCANLTVKIATNNSFAVRQGSGTPEQLYGLLVEHFGARRVMWGSNYPAHTHVYGKLDERVDLARRDLAFLSEEDRRWVMGETALRLWPMLRA
jgi:predicted TIM-barrel fold metal-dependent hydrolase